MPEPSVQQTITPVMPGVGFALSGGRGHLRFLNERVNLSKVLQRVYSTRSSYLTSRIAPVLRGFLGHKVGKRPIRWPHPG